MEVGYRTCAMECKHPDVEGLLLEKGVKYLTRPKVNDKGEIFVCSSYWFWIGKEYFNDDYVGKYGVLPPEHGGE